MRSQAQRLLITGASGYIGARLVTLATRAGWEVAVLGSPPLRDSTTRAYSWRLGDKPPAEALAGVQALVHLGHAWKSANESENEPDPNVAGTVRLAGAALSAGIQHFVFASSTSARVEALNRYGRAKHAIEQRLLALPGSAGRIEIARIGLVYGGPDRGLYGLLSKLVELSPVLPMIGLDREVQPIHLDDVCKALLRLADGPPPDRQVLVVAGPSPVSFAEWLRILRYARTGKRLALVPVPISLALTACDLTRIVPFLPTVDRERVLGLAGAAPMASVADLAALGIVPADPAARLAKERASCRRRLAEAKALLRYVAPDRRVSVGAVIRLAKALERDSPCPALPGLVLRWPVLMRFLEPWRPSMHHALSRRLHLAAMVAESSAPTYPAHGGSAFRLLRQLAVEGLVLPARLLLGRLYA